MSKSLSELQLIACVEYIRHRVQISDKTFWYGRDTDAVIARQLVMYALNHYSGLSGACIAILFDRQPSGVYKGIKKIERLGSVPEVIEVCRELRDLLHTSARNLLQSEDQSTQPIRG